MARAAQTQMLESPWSVFTAWNSGDGLHIGEQHLIEIVCPEMSDPELCETLVLTYWEKIAQIIFSERGAGLMCNHIDPQCEKPSMRWLASTLYRNIFQIIFKYFIHFELIELGIWTLVLPLQALCFEH